MKTVILFLTTFFLTMATASAYVKPLRYDMKPATQVMLQSQSFGTPIAASTTRVLSGNAGPTSAAVKTVTTFSAQPDVPRNLVITPGGTTGDIENCVITVTGTNIKNQTITEDFTFAANDTGAQTGNKAFKTVSSVSWPADCESGGFAATWSVGVGEKIGLDHCMDVAGNWVFSTVAGAYETTRATIAASATAVESNTADFNGTMNGTNAFYGYYLQNYRCQ